MKNLIRKGVKFWESEISLRIFFVSIVVLNFVIIPLMSENQREGSFFTRVFFLFLVITGSIAIIKTQKYKYSVYFLCVVSFIFWFLSRNFEHNWIEIADGLIQSLIFLLFIILILIKVFQGGVYTLQRLEGAMTGLLLFGNLFAILYYTMNLILGPNTFSVPGGESLAAFTYFSFTTLTTLGYGDVLPIHPIVRSLSNMEAVIGTLYPAVLIARLLSLDKPTETES